MWWFVLVIGLLVLNRFLWLFVVFFFFQAEDGIRDAQESRGLGDVYKRQSLKNWSLRYYTFNSYPEIPGNQPTSCICC